MRRRNPSSQRQRRFRIGPYNQTGGHSVVPGSKVPQPHRLLSVAFGHRSTMTPTLNRFAARLAELQGTPRKFKYVHGPPPAATIPAQHEAVGDMTIYDDGDELTIDIGHKHHTHVSCYN